MRVLFTSAYSAIDPSSGAAISIRTLLRLLTEYGVQAGSFGGSIFDRAPSADPVQNLRSAGAEPTDPTALLADVWERRDGEVIHRTLPVPRWGRMLQTRTDEERLFEMAKRELDRTRPDVLLSYGDGIYEQLVVAEARRRGIVTVFYLANPSYRSAELFAFYDQVFTDTVATRDLYVERLGLDPYAIGKFVDRPTLRDDAQPRFITYVNPSPEKGVTLFYRIAELSAQVAPELEFLVVESRATLAQIEQHSRLPFSRLRNVVRVGLQRDMGDVFSHTRVVLQPSVWHESGARSAIEAMSLGLPIVATTRGGIPEIAGDAGILIPPPEQMIANHWFVPPMTAAVPWVEALRQLIGEPDFYAEHRERSLKAYEAHDPARRLPDVVALLEQRIAERKQGRKSAAMARLALHSRKPLG